MLRWRTKQAVATPEPAAFILTPAAGYGLMVAIVGESFHRESLQRLSRRVGTGLIDNERRYIAQLVPELRNAYDENAIRVDIEGLAVGHLCRADAAAYRPVLMELLEQGLLGRCEARMFCREGKPNIGVWLDLAAPDECCGQLTTGPSDVL